MNLGLKQSEDLLIQFRDALANFQNKVEVVICPSSVFLTKAQKILQGTNIKLGSQNIFWEERGAFTGETSAGQITEAGCQYVIIGHSEQKRYGGLTSDQINKEIFLSLRERMRPIVCMGETFDQRKDNQKNIVVNNQLAEALKNISPQGDDLIIIAYEPIWAISTNRGYYCEPQEAKETATVIKHYLFELYSEDTVNEHFVICYGGNVDKDNVLDYVDKKMFYGALVGGASIKMDQFPKIVELLNQ